MTTARKTQPGNFGFIQPMDRRSAVLLKIAVAQDRIHSATKISAPLQAFAAALNTAARYLITGSRSLHFTLQLIHSTVKGIRDEFKLKSTTAASRLLNLFASEFSELSSGW